MYKFNKILVGLDQSEMDEQLIDAACTICKLSGTKKIFFVNLIQNFDIPDKVLLEFPDIKKKALAERKAALDAEIKSRFTCENVLIEILVLPGQATKEIMKIAAQKSIDLIVLGRKNEVKGGGVLINRLTRRASCSLLVIPKGIELKINRLLVPIDFSSYSKLSMEKAIALAKANSSIKTKIIAQNVFQVPTGYHYTGKTFEEFAEVMRENAHNDYLNFLTRLKLKTDKVDVEALYTLDRDDDIIKHIYDTAKDTKSDIIIIGAKGRSATTALFIGSEAEKLVQVNTEVPLLVIRPKGKTAGFLEYLREI